jgi:hypothetical protein
MGRIVLDALSHQAIRQAGTEAAAYGLPPEKAGRWRDRRLTGFLSAIEALGHQLDLALPTPQALGDAEVLVIASRSQALMFSADDLAAITAFVRAGGGLLLMANHRLFVAPQQQVVAVLDLPLRIEDVSIAGSPEIRCRPHPVTDGCSRLAIRNGSIIRPAASADVLATFTDPSLAFAVASDRNDRRGRVVVTADSGFIASLDDKQQSLFEAADNARFITNAITWLLAPG